MKKNSRTVFVTAFISLFIFINKFVYAEEQNKNILYLNSYHRGLEWSDKIEEGILSELKSTKNNIDIKIEYMDSKENPDEIYYKNLINFYKYKYSNKKFDLIICSDNQAFEFLLQYRKELFNDIPIVFCGVNGIEKYDLKNINNITGIVEMVNIKDNIQLILKLNPDTKNIDIVMDSSYIGKMFYDDLNELLKTNKFNAEINIINNLSFEDTIKQINSLPGNRAVLFMATYITNNNGIKIYPSKAVKLLREKTAQPIYGIFDTMLNYGIIGGEITSGIEQGKNAGEMALKILSGELSSNIPIKKAGGTSYIFDYKELEKFSIPQDKLPKDSTIINEPSSVYSIAKDEMKNGIVVIIITFSIIILFLIINIINRKKLENKLNKNQKQLQKNINFLKALLDTIPSPVFCKDVEGRYTECNIQYEKFVGLNREQIINKTVFDMEQGSLAKVYNLADSNLMKNGGTQVYEAKVKYADGTIKDVLFSKATINDEHYEAEGIVGVMVDITERKRQEERVSRISRVNEAIIEVNQSIIGMENIRDLFDLILQKAIKSIDGAEHGTILLLTEDRKLILAAFKGYDRDKAKEFSIPLEKSFLWSKTGGKIKDTTIINNVDELDNVDDTDITNKKWSIKSCIVAPIIIDGKLYGMLNIDSNKMGAFTEADLQILDYMKNQIEISISKHKLYEEIIYLSRYDNLTQMYNRKYFEDIFFNQFNNKTHFTLVIFDLNRLKFVNDNFGHLAGDNYIITFVNGLKTIIEDKDVIARYGGDEFIGIFYNEEQIIINKFEDLKQHFKKNPLNLKKDKIPCSFSYGIATFPSDSKNYKDLIKIADDRMYKYKEKTKEKR